MHCDYYTTIGESCKNKLNALVQFIKMRKLESGPHYVLPSIVRRSFIFEILSKVFLLNMLHFPSCNKVPNTYVVI